MNLTTSLLFYLLIGGGVAAAVHLSLEAAGSRERWFRTLTAVAFWPLYLPVLLSRPAEPASEPSIAPVEPRDEIAAAIAQVEAELDLALASLDGWSDAALAREQHRF